MPENTNTDFDKSIEFVLSWEGGYVNDPKDPGGETNFGISKHSFPTLDIKNLTRDQAKQIYFEKYWLKAGCDRLAWPLNMVVMDTSVNCGVIPALEMLKDVSKDDINHTAMDMAKDMIVRRLDYYLKICKANNKLDIFLKGWFRRCLRLYDALSQ
jgi:lysozyme family protein